MMTDAISRRRVLNALEAEKARLMGGKGCDWPFTGEILAKAVDTVIDFIKQVPALDVAPVVRARWMLDSSFYSARIYHCTACNMKQMQTSKFCPECGARMDGEAE